jgi:hypothetical protein
MKITHYNIQVLMEFDTLQPGEPDAAELKKTITKSMEKSVPAGCRIKELTVKETGTEEKDLKEFLSEMKKEYQGLKQAEKDLAVDQIMNVVKGDFCNT